MKLLVVEDSELVQEYLILTLKNAGFKHTEICDNAEDAIAAVQKPGKIPDLILMDITLPGMSGIDATRELKNIEYIKDIPVIMLTAHSSEEYLEAAFSAGAVDYITKPVKKVELLARLNSALRLKREMDRRKRQEQALIDMNLRLARVNEQFEKLSQVDSLTGLSNRRHFDHILELEWNMAVTERSSLAIMMIDVDYFKPYNDNYGHQAGDAVLVDLSERMLAILSRPGDHIARYGGEEFIVLLPGTDEVGAATVAEKLKQGIANLAIPHAYAGEKIITVSVGVAACQPTASDNRETLISRADKALYHAKQCGRNNVQAFSSI